MKLAEQAVRVAPDFDEVCLFAAETAVRLRRPLLALEHCQRVRNDRPETAAARRMADVIEL